MTRPELPVLIAQLRADLEQCGRVVQKVDGFWGLAGREGRTEERLAALAISLHNFYNGVERIFDRIARAVDESQPSGPSSHRELLDRMVVSVEGLRPAVIDEATRASLRPFLEFRHRVRHLYYFDLAWQDVADLATQLAGVWPGLRRELELFFSEIDAKPS